MTGKTQMTKHPTTDRLSTGIGGVDEILHGGLLPGRSTLVRGPPGAGKTLFGVHFLARGAEDGDTSLFINLGEPEEYLRHDVASFGFDFDRVEFLDLGPQRTSSRMRPRMTCSRRPRSKASPSPPKSRTPSRTLAPTES